MPKFDDIIHKNRNKIKIFSENFFNNFSFCAIIALYAKKAVQIADCDGGFMEDKFTQIECFLNVCDELVEGKFILADTKIGELLRCIAASTELTNLFGAVTDGFDYAAAKKLYLRFPAEKGAAHGTAYLPKERGDVLAFVFCLLAEIDAGALKIGDFLLRYFYEDGSYTASYALFADRMIRPFRDIVRDCFPDCGRRGRLAALRKKEADALGLLTEKISTERARVASAVLSAEDKGAGESILAELYAAAGRGDIPEIRALSFGYGYFLSAVGLSAGAYPDILELVRKLTAEQE